MHRTCASPNQTKSQHSERGWTHNSTPSCGAADNCYLLVGGEAVFSKHVASGKPKTLQWKIM